MINENRIQEFLKLFSFPRIYGSAEERKALEIAKQEIEKLNQVPLIQHFTYTRFFTMIYSRVMFTFILGFLIIFHVNCAGFLTNIFLLILLGLTVGFIIISRSPERLRITKELESRNLYTKIQSQNIKNDTQVRREMNVFFMAHLDSKSQRFNITIRVRIFILWFFSLVLSIFFIILKNFIFHYYAPKLISVIIFMGSIPISLNALTVLLLFLNTTSNHSCGALDDGSGVACVLELLNHYMELGREGKSNYLNLWFVLTGAEECGTMGVRHFFNIMNDESITKDNSLIINFDSIGTKLDLIKFGLTKHKSFKYQDIFLKHAQDLELGVKTRHVPIGVHTDGYFFFKKGFQGIEFGDWDAYKYLHSVNDTIDKVDSSLLRKTCELVIKSLNEIEKQLSNS